jgi:hypothetical protein
MFFGAPLSGLEETCEGPDAFRAFCHRLCEEYAETADRLLKQWHLEPVIIGPSPARGPLEQDLPTWVDPFNDCFCSDDEGYQIQAATGRDLWHNNRSAPRLLRLASGPWAIQTTCAPLSEEKPAIGGLVVWKDKSNYVRLIRGLAGSREIALSGCIDNKDVVLGRGQMDLGTGQSVVLRLERTCERRQVRALCSANGSDWFAVGHCTFAVEDPINVGICAIGQIDRTIYHGAFPKGTAMHFGLLKIWLHQF